MLEENVLTSSFRAAGAGGAATDGLTSHRSVLIDGIGAAAAATGGRGGAWMTSGVLAAEGASPQALSSNSDGYESEENRCEETSE